MISVYLFVISCRSYWLDAFSTVSSAKSNLFVYNRSFVASQILFRIRLKHRENRRSPCITPRLISIDPISIGLLMSAILVWLPLCILCRKWPKDLVSLWSSRLSQFAVIHTVKGFLDVHEYVIDRLKIILWMSNV